MNTSCHGKLPTHIDVIVMVEGSETVFLLYNITEPLSEDGMVAFSVEVASSGSSPCSAQISVGNELGNSQPTNITFGKDV